MEKLHTLKDGLLNQLRDLYSAEIQMLEALPKMEERATNGKLKEIFASHRSETERQIERLDEISSVIQDELTSGNCKAMFGLVQEVNEVLGCRSDNRALIDTLIIAAAQRIEHYEIAAYSTAREIAIELGQDEIVKLLGESLYEERAADKDLLAISQSEVLAHANIPATSENDEIDDGDPRRNPPRTFVRGVQSLRW